MNIEHPNHIPAAAGYVFSSSQHGAFDPDGKVALAPTPEDVVAHNREVSERTLTEMRATGRAVLYLFAKGTAHDVGTWDGGKKWHVHTERTSRHNIGRTRLDVWFTVEGARWHGVNIGDNDIVRCKRCKS